VWWVELAPLPPGGDVAAAVAAVLHVRAGPGRDVAETLGEALAGQDGLLVLDNCEHVIDPAAALVEQLLRVAPGLAVLTTSREALAVEGELAWQIAPLAHLPVSAVGTGRGEVTVDELGAYEGVRLFVERAQAVQPGFALTERTAPAVAAIVARLDGLPLALELAAAAVPALGVDALAERLDDVFGVLTRGRRTALPRHRTLRALLDWSHALLDEAERTLLARLAVFRGAFTLDGAVAVGVGVGVDPEVEDGAPGDDGAIVGALGRLVEQSLVEVRESDGETRYRLLETVRQYGLARLRESAGEERRARARHARWVTALAQAAEPLMFGPARGRTIARLERELGEVRAALAWAIAPGGEVGVALRLSGALGWFWFTGVGWDEARAWTRAVLDAADREGIADADRPLGDRIGLGTLLYPTAGLAWFAGEADAMVGLTARELAVWDSVAAEPGLTGAQRLSAQRGRAICLQLRGLAFAMRREFEVAMPLLAEAIAVAAAAGDAWLKAVLTVRRPLAWLAAGRLAEAAADYATAAPALRALGERWFLSLCEEGRARTAIARGDLGAATAFARESVEVLRPEPDAWFIARALDTLAVIAVRGGFGGAEGPARARTAARLLGAAEGLRRRCGATVLGFDAPTHAATTAATRAALGDDAYGAAHAAGMALGLEGIFALAAGGRVLSPEVVVAPGSATAADPGERVDAARAAAAAPAASVLAADEGGAPGGEARDGAPPAGAERVTSAGSLAVLAFGPLSVVRDGVALTPAELAPAKARELLLYFVLHPPRTKEQIALALWPDASEARVRNAFHVTMHHLRRILGRKDAVAFDGRAYALVRGGAADGEATALDCDVDAVLAAAAAVRESERRRRTVDAPTRAGWRAALARAERGPLGEGVDAGDWLVEHQDRARAEWAAGMEGVARLDAGDGAHAEAAATLESLVARDPLRESAHRALMQAYVALGEPARALAHYDALTALLAREVGTAPARETRQLADALRRAAAV
jgi:predicted ATPase/DNA-binding SARP family transcriptional activator